MLSSLSEVECTGQASLEKINSPKYAGAELYMVLYLL